MRNIGNKTKGSRLPTVGEFVESRKIIRRIDRINVVERKSIYPSLKILLIELIEIIELKIFDIVFC